jgi:hypothetical protein
MSSRFPVAANSFLPIGSKRDGELGAAMTANADACGVTRQLVRSAIEENGDLEHEA